MNPSPNLVPANGKAIWYVENLTTVREILKLTQQKLAELTQKHDPQGRGVSKDTISKMERMHGVVMIKASIVMDTLMHLIGGASIPVLPVLTRTPKQGASGMAVADS